LGICTDGRADRTQLFLPTYSVIQGSAVILLLTADVEENWKYYLESHIRDYSKARPYRKKAGDRASAWTCTLGFIQPVKVRSFTSESGDVG